MDVWRRYVVSRPGGPAQEAAAAPETATETEVEPPLADSTPDALAGSDAPAEDEMAAMHRACSLTEEEAAEDAVPAPAADSERRPPPCVAGLVGDPSIFRLQFCSDMYVMR